MPCPCYVFPLPFPHALLDDHAPRKVLMLSYFSHQLPHTRLRSFPLVMVFPLKSLHMKGMYVSSSEYYMSSIIVPYFAVYIITVVMYTVKIGCRQQIRLHY
jgi:hypothetical protein